ncbi:phage holin [Staphylococcus devriesei]|uniref:phage holin n=1 Tax=Staphylococcus devriesei TaxID=586733 RepID=UPI000D1C5B3D|nr:phage holin [Staphylococcus devriesei]PTF04595.1 phage holin [Staphylococcus devriesei]PTF20424.1 phage holin [Staphylococcus devriesei]
MNWKLRIKNKATLTGLVGAVLLFIKQVTEVFGLDLSIQLEQIGSLIGAILTLLAGLGIVVDPTSKGVKDSGIVQTYNKPRDSKNPDEFVEWQNVKDENKACAPELNEKEPKTFDTSLPFTDDDDEVEWDVSDYEEDENLMRGQSRLHEEVK